MAESGGCCRCCFSFIFTLGLTALFMWLSLRTSKPKCIILSFYLPALNKTLNDTKNSTIVLNLRLQNTNKDKGIYYDAVNLTFQLPGSTTTTKPVATASVPPFYQGHNKKANKPVTVPPPELNWTAVKGSVHPNNGTVRIRVDLATAVRYKVMVWKTKRHRLRVGADVDVDESGGAKIHKKGIKLSAAVRPDHQLVGGFGQVGVLANILVFIFLNFL